MDIDPECNYCPACRDEYRPEITTCPACGVALESGAALRARLDRQRIGRPAPIGPDEPLALVRRGPLGQIRQLQALLEAHGLAAIACADGPAGCRTTCRGAELLLQVRAADLAEVLALLDEEHRRTTVLTDYDTSLADEVFDAGRNEATCPACGCRFPTSSSTCPDCGLSFA
jgi:hypothetical protein